MASVPLDAGGSPAGAMKLVGGDPSLDFVNTVGGRIPDGSRLRTRVQGDKLAAYSDLVAFAAHRRLLSEASALGLLRRGGIRPRAARAVLLRSRAFREALHRTLRALMQRRRPSPADLARLNEEVRSCRRREALVPRAGGLRFELGSGARSLEAPLWPVVRSAAAMLTTVERAHLRQCGGHGCGWLFLDRSRNRSRRWCTMEDCGNRAKVRRFRRRHARARPAGSVR